MKAQIRKLKNKLFLNIILKKDFKNRQKLLSQYQPDTIRPSVVISPTMKKYQDELIKTGLVKIPNMFIELSDYINKEYFEKAENNSINQWHKDTMNKRQKDMGRTISLQISFSDKKLKNLFFNDDLIGIVYNYYKRQPYYRNLPILAKQEDNNTHKLDIQGKFHLDGGLNQISFMLLTEDISMDDTHMEYALGANNNETPYNIDRFSWKDSDIEQNYDICHLIGKKGTLFIFDAGNGYHRASYKKGSIRKILHLNMTHGHSLQGQFEHELASFDFLENQRDYVKESITKLIK